MRNEAISVAFGNAVKLFFFLKQKEGKALDQKKIDNLLKCNYGLIHLNLEGGRSIKRPKLGSRRRIFRNSHLGERENSSGKSISVCLETYKE